MEALLIQAISRWAITSGCQATGSQSWKSCSHF
jgi:hypothetical protein